jgi:hypothetical protein
MNQEYLKTILDYNPESGKFIWIRRNNSKTINSIYAGCLRKDTGYVTIQIDRKQYFAHSLAWLYMTGSFIEEGYEIDHKDRNKSNNSWSNLRKATKGQNQANSYRKLATSKYRGVRYHPKRKRFYAETYVNNKYLYIGSFLCEEEAALAYNEKAKTLFGEFATLNKIEPDWSTKIDPITKELKLI